jgi:nucleoside phosphorylase
MTGNQASTRIPIRQGPQNRPNRSANRRSFEIALFCALPVEAEAVRALFDDLWDDTGSIYGKSNGDPNAYSLGAIRRHHVVLVHLPGMGNNGSAAAAASCRASFPCIRLALVVGICGGAPSGPDGDIFLGDTIISEGVIQYDFGRRYDDTFQRKATVADSLGRPSSEIRALLAKLKENTTYALLNEETSGYLNSLIQRPDRPFKFPGITQDRLFPRDYRHKHQDLSSCQICAACHQSLDKVCKVALSATCDELGCASTAQMSRPRPDYTSIHFGLMASSNGVIKSAQHRDHIAKEESVIAFEMEGAGIWDQFPCLVIKGVCDYADSHKNKRWQRYAAASAAACMKAFLHHWAPSSFSVDLPTRECQYTWSFFLFESFINIPDLAHRLKIESS